MKRTIAITRDEDTCVKCGECIDVCPHSGEDSLVKTPVIRQEPGEVPYIENPENCIGCFSCKDTCRSEAIAIEGVEEINSIIVEKRTFEMIKNIL